MLTEKGKAMNEREIIAKEWRDDNGILHRREVGQELVRCKECKHSPKNTKEIPLHDSCYTFNPDDFCSYGERRE